MKNISLLGSTGSIGTSTLHVIGNNPERFRVVALAGYRNISLLGHQIEQFKPKVVSVADEKHARELKKILGGFTGTEICFGPEGYRAVASFREADMVVSAMVGAAGLLPTLAAVEAGKKIALANKEALVMAGSIITGRARESGAAILPVDSEHSAIFQCIHGQNSTDIRRIILTASGGPFLCLTKTELASVKPDQALRHPNWRMGKKITIDSATLMNKGLEVIEARWLFSVDFDNIEVLIHPQSIVHSMVEFIDGSVLAQLGVTDMKIPIAYALSYPERIRCGGGILDVTKVGTLEFHKPDTDKFPSLRLAYEAGRAAGTMPAVLNAANEVAVNAFMKGSVKFTEIPDIVEKTLSRHQANGSPSLEDILEADRWARVYARSLLKG
ncbi:MAG: 1-deoxy-D-xylulose-5-phosphate reductoisomerase [Deltaproteobacteria bacterium]|nr:1-deoxy-D-xylulose-5-phosphate reductoisomerase [Deltaproteobacteria bacterium]